MRISDWSSDVCSSDLVGLALGISGVVAYQKVPSGFMPAMDEGGFILDHKVPPGTALQDTDAMLRQVEPIITATPDGASYSRRTVIQLRGGLPEAYAGEYYARLTCGSRRSIELVVTDTPDQHAHTKPRPHREPA